MPNGDQLPVNLQIFDSRVKRLIEEHSRQRSGTGGGGMDVWQHSVESRLSGLDGHVLDLRTEIRESRAELRGEIRDLRIEMSSWFRWLLGLLVVLFGSMLGVMAKGFGWV